MATKKILTDLVSNGDIESTSFIKTGGTSSQFLKADGSVDSTNYTNIFRAIHDTPVDAATTTSISSNWAFDNVKTAVPSGAVFIDTTYDLSGYLLNTTDTLTGDLTITGVSTLEGIVNIDRISNGYSLNIGTTGSGSIFADGRIFSSTSIFATTSITGATIVKNGGTSSQFLKADGSVDSNTYLTSSSTQSKYLRSDADDFTTGNLGLNTDKKITFDSNVDGFSYIRTISATDGDRPAGVMVYGAVGGHHFIDGEDNAYDNIVASGFKTPSGTSSQFLKADGSTDSTDYVDTTTAETISGAKKFTNTVEGMGGNLHSYGGDVAFDAFQGYGTIRELATDEYVIPFLGSPHIVGQGNLTAGTTNSRAGTSTYIETAQYDFDTDDQIPYGVVWIRRQGKALISLVAKTKDEAASHIASRLKVGYTPTDNYGDQANSNTLDVNGNIHAVSSVSASSFIKDSGTSSQFLKADGSVDSNTYLTSSSTQSKYLRSDTADSSTGTISAPKFYVGAVSSASQWAFQARNNASTSDSGIYFDSGHGNILLRNSLNVLSTRIDSSGVSYFNGGNVAVGHTSATAKLDVFRDESTYAVNLSNCQSRSGFTIKPSNGFDSKITFSSGASSAQYIQALNNSANTGKPIVINPYGGNFGVGVELPSLAVDIKSGTNNGIRISATDTNNNWRDLSIRSYTSESEADALPAGVHMFTTNPSGATGNAFSKYGGFVIQCRDDGNSSFAVRVGASLAEAFFINHNAASTFISTVTASNFILSSDKRLKEDIKKVDNKHIDVDWKTFKLKSDNSQNRYGVIAQELEEVHPEFVRTDDKGMKSVAYIDLLIAKIAELEARLDKANI